MTVLAAGLRYFALVFGAGFVLGALRVTLVVPWLGVRYAELAEMPLMFVVIVVAAAHVVRRHRLASSGTRLAAGLCALLLLVGAELALAVALAGRSLSDYIASRDPVAGSVYVVLLIVFALMPALLRRTARRPTPASA